jgi:hypothetical protein
MKQIKKRLPARAAKEKNAATKKRAMAKKHAAGKKRAAGKNSAAARRAPAPLVPHEASPAQQAKLFKAVGRALKDQGVAGEIKAIHLTPANQRAPMGCPPGQVSRIVCFKKKDGTVVCESRCQPI